MTIKKMFLLFVKIISLIGILVVILIHVFEYTEQMPTEIIRSLFEDNNMQVSIENIDTDFGPVRIIVRGNKATDSTLIVFVHGTPGTWKAWEQYMLDTMLSKNASLLAYDRPGYSKGSISTPSIDDQAQVLRNIIVKYKMPNVVLVSHSYGCAIAVALHNYKIPEIKKIAMIAPVIHPYEEPFFWFSYFANWPITKIFLPRSLQVAGDEKFDHPEELKKMEEVWSNVNIDILHVHGVNDGLAPSQANMKWSNDNIASNKLQIIKIENGGHFIIWTKFELVRNYLYRFIYNKE